MPTELVQEPSFARRFAAFALIDVLAVGFVLFMLIVQVVGPIVVAVGTGAAGIQFLGQQIGGPRETIFSAVEGCDTNLLRPVCVVYDSQREADDAESASDLIFGGAMLTFVIAWFLYFWRGNARGQTIGKQVFEIRVVRDGSRAPLGAWRGLLRTLAYGLSGMLVTLGFLWALWDARKQSLHDKICKSIIVREAA